MPANNIPYSPSHFPASHTFPNHAPSFPTGWHERSLPDGRKYYYHDSGVSTWTHPTQQTSLPSSSQPATASASFLPSAEYGAYANRQVMRQAQESVESRLGKEKSHPELYATGAQTAQLSYLGRHAQKQNGMTELSIEAFDKYWSHMFSAGKLRVAEMYEGPAAVELTDPSMAVGSSEAISCVLAFARTTVNISGSNRTFGACIHVDPADPAIGSVDAINPLKAYELVFKSLYLSLKSLQPAVPELSRLEFFVNGASRDAEAEVSLRLAAATIHAARCTGINVVGCMLPTNSRGEGTSSFMTKNAIYYAKEDLSDDK